jgi:hypothetical protein
MVRVAGARRILETAPADRVRAGNGILMGLLDVRISITNKVIEYITQIL